MVKKLNSMPDYRARMPKHPHDLSKSHAFTSSTGMLLPIYYDMLHLGDELHFSADMFTRLNPLNIASLAEIDIHLDYFFVPCSVIYTPFTSIMYQTDDLFSSAFAGANLSNKQGFPKLDIDGCLDQIRTSSNGGVNTPQPIAGGNGLTYYNEAFDSWGKAAIRLLDCFNYSHDRLFSSVGDYNPITTPWFLCAYHACYYDYFRNDDREARSYIYNLDTQSGLGASDNFSNGLYFTLHYASAYKDYFNSIKVSPISSTVSFLSGEQAFNMLTDVGSFINPTYQGKILAGLFEGSNGKDDYTDTIEFIHTQTSNNSPVPGTYSPLYLSASGIRQLFMVDKLLRVTGRARKDYESQFLAHFGIEIPHDVLHSITHIGHDMVTLRPQAIVSSADTFNGETGAALGEIGGQGYVDMKGHKHNFTAPCHGVFICIYHSQPRMRYYAGIDKLHDLSDPMKFWQPEYDRRGMQPIFLYEVTKQPNDSSRRLGWQFAYEQFKRKYDTVSLAFAYPGRENVNTYNPWVLSREPYQLPNGMPMTTDTVLLSNFTSLLVSPKELDNIMTVQYQTTWIQDLQLKNAHLLFQTDPFIHDFKMNCKKVNMMSEFGEPELD